MEGNTRKSVLIISYIPPYNRQGCDLGVALRNRGYDAIIFQKDGQTDERKCVVGIPCIQPRGVFHKFQMLVNAIRFLGATWRAPKKVVICVGKTMLPLGALYSLLFGSKLIWYSLEYSRLGLVSRYIYRHFVKGYVDVEENRCESIFKLYDAKSAYSVCYNMPHRFSGIILGGKLRNYLRKNYAVSRTSKIAIYAGSYQKYACIDRIVSASSILPEGYLVVLMAYGLPDNKAFVSQQCIVVPPVNGDEFYEWLADADCALLPYESATDFNVLNCSPQKLFDCFLVQVPFVASNRPIVRNVLQMNSDVGMMCDFNDEEKLAKAIVAVAQKKPFVCETMRRLHSEKYNYEFASDSIVSVIEQVVS